MKTTKAIFAVLQVVCVLVAASTIFVPTPEFVFPAACGAVLLLLGLEGLVTNEVATRINLILKNKNKVFFYLMVATWFLFSALMFLRSYSLWAKPKAENHNGKTPAALKCNNKERASNLVAADGLRFATPLRP